MQYAASWLQGNEQMPSRSKLGVCGSCGGFVPSDAASCVHCKASVRSRFGALRTVSAVAGVLGSGAMAFTLMACYGGACVDGGCDDYSYDDDAGNLNDAARDATLPDVRVGDPDASRDASSDAADDADPDGGDGGDRDAG